VSPKVDENRVVGFSIESPDLGVMALQRFGDYSRIVHWLGHRTIHRLSHVIGLSMVFQKKKCDLEVL
jgi:hypothetical protein